MNYRHTIWYALACLASFPLGRAAIAAYGDGLGVCLVCAFAAACIFYGAERA